MPSIEAGTSKDEDDEMNEWRAEEDLRTLVEAEKIKGDPKRLKAAMAKKRELAKALKSMGGAGNG